MRYPLALKELRKRRGLSQKQVADIMEVEQPTYQRWEAGTRDVDSQQLQRLADAFGVSPGELFGGSNIMPVGPRLFVKGAVAAGVWREAMEWPQEDWEVFHGRADLTVPLEMRFGLRVEGDSMNERYPHGTIVDCVSLQGGAELVSEKNVVVMRKNDRGECEATVKEYLVDADGVEWLVPRSYNPAFQRPIKLKEPEPGIEEVRVIAVVVGSYRPE